MRKQYKRKLKSCPLCKPHKTGDAIRWTKKEQLAMKLAEKEIRENESK